MKIYTKRGDTGETDSMRGCRMSKSSPESKAIGAIDELKTHVSQSLIMMKNQNKVNSFKRSISVASRITCVLCVSGFLAFYQLYLLSMFISIVCMNSIVNKNAEYASKNSIDDFVENSFKCMMVELHQISSMISNSQNTEIKLGECAVEDLEETIDVLDGTLGPLSNFILHFNNSVAVNTDICRTICRRAERDIVVIKDDIDPIVIRYINRLSDALFMISRQLDVDYSTTFVSADDYVLDEEEEDDETDNESSSDEATPDGRIDVELACMHECKCDGECAYGECECECEDACEHQ